MDEYIELEPRYIDINKFSIPKGFFNQDLNVPKIFDLLYSQPSADVVEVVRCKDCKHFCPYEGEEHKGDCAELVGLESCVYEDDYCSYGERRS